MIKLKEFIIMKKKMLLQVHALLYFSALVETDSNNVVAVVVGNATNVAYHVASVMAFVTARV